MAGIFSGPKASVLQTPAAPPPTPTQAEAALAAEKKRMDAITGADEERKRARKSASGVLLDKPGAASASSLLGG